MSMFLCRASSRCCVWDSSGSGPISIIHASLSEISALIAAFRQLYDVEERAVGGGGGREHFRLCVWGGND